MINFNDVIAHGGLELDGVRLLRHDRRGLAHWTRSMADFDHFASFQKSGSKGPLRGASVAFHFVPGRRLDDGDHTALFVRAHRVLDQWAWTSHERLPALIGSLPLTPSNERLAAFDLEPLEAYGEFEGRALVRWGRSVRGWSQWAARQPKELLELRLSAEEPAFPGFARFAASVDDVPLLPLSWVGALSSVGGVYLLVCPDTGEQYVGSATGENGFYGRWSSYAADGHGGNQLLKARKRRNYGVSILEALSPDMAPRDVIARETAWKTKLGSRAHGLNAN